MSNYIKVILVIVSLIMVVVIGYGIKDGIPAVSIIEFVKVMGMVVKAVVIKLYVCIV